MLCPRHGGRCPPAPKVAAQLSSLTLLEEGKTADDARRCLARDLVPTMQVGILFWPAVGIMCSRFVPVMNRPAANSVAGLFWSMFMSHRANSGGMEPGIIATGTPDSHRSEMARMAESEDIGVDPRGGLRRAQGPVLGGGATPSRTPRSRHEAAAYNEDGGAAQQEPRDPAARK